MFIYDIRMLTLVFAVPALSQLKLVESRSGHSSKTTMVSRGSVSDRPIAMPSMSATQEVC